MSDRSFNVLFRCTGNSARSIMAECILRQVGARCFNTFWAGSHPRGAAKASALKTLTAYGLSAEGLCSKDW